ncbi:hypothetical protein QBC33DRAFT_595257 [Phialemonium atrogriseum]|uniref:Chitin-binding type-1 domain-containing protein n=1 Tax=Phialemonium atrogriseum TaxID=1093897 RepID=A0AAJ0FDD3_9PEZI|nr:uncharacterized protein QBC33DRAFT_595257 [Phialemonium atrogriseum]KAK1764471.1 hypothetical protein QBC33DRAFT_595257 [Phialemonium atrogriseum]
MATLSSRRLITAILGVLACGAGTALGGQLSARACAGTVKAKNGDTCASLARDHGITVSQFLLDNPAVSSCDLLVIGQEYCIAEDAGGPPAVSTGSSSRPTSTASSPSPTPKVSEDGSCGNGVTCAGSEFGTCCSEHGYCGDGDNYCLAGCQQAFGKCDNPGGGAPGGTTAPPATQPAGPTATTTVTKTSLVTSTKTSTTIATSIVTSLVIKTTTSTAVIGAPATSTATVTATVTSTKTATSIVIGTATGPGVGAPVTSTTILTLTSKVVTTSTATVTTTSTFVRTATSIVLGGSGTTTTTRTVTSTVVGGGACSPTKPDTVITPTRGPQPSAPSPTLPGTAENCRTYYKVSSNDTCLRIAQRNGISQSEFISWNPSIGATSNPLDAVLCSPGLLDLLLQGLCQVSCDNLWEGYYVCVEA